MEQAVGEVDGRSQAPELVDGPSGLTSATHRNLQHSSGKRQHLRPKPRHGRQHTKPLDCHQPPTQRILTERTTRGMCDQHNPDFFASISSHRLKPFHLLYPSAQILRHRGSRCEVHAPEPRVPAVSVAAIADRVARVATCGEECHIYEPDRSAAEAAMCEEERRFGGVGISG